MARLTYQAPGVYVEEVPSTQKPIAGVGTNTVGFIGIVPDEIQYPVRNDDYDPELAKISLKVAKLIAQGAEVPEADREAINAQIEEIRDDIRELEADKNAREAERDTEQSRLEDVMAALTPLEELEEDGLSDDQRRERTTQRSRRTQAQNAIVNLNDQIEGIDSEIQQKQSTMTNLERRQSGQIVAPEAGQASAMRPYYLETFEVKVKPGVTKLCTNFTEYQNYFGTFSAEPYEKEKVGQAMYPGHRALTHAVYGFFQNGGTRCFVARIRDESGLRDALLNFESIDAIAIVAAPGLVGKGNYDALVSHCKDCEDRFAILD